MLVKDAFNIEDLLKFEQNPNASKLFTAILDLSFGSRLSKEAVLAEKNDSFIRLQ